MKIRTLAGTLIALIAATSVATASEIYKWTDDEGNVHYTDKPLGNPSERLDITSRPTSDAVVQSQVAAVQNLQTAHAERLASAAEGKSPDEIRAEKEERAQQCSKYRERQTQFAQSRNLYREGADGEREYLDEAQAQEARNKVAKQVEEYCDS